MNFSLCSPGNPSCNVFSFIVDRSLLEDGQMFAKAELQLHLSRIPPDGTTWRLGSHHHHSKNLTAIHTPATRNGTLLRLDVTRIVRPWLRRARFGSHGYHRRRIMVQMWPNSEDQLLCSQNSSTVELTGRKKPVLLVFSTSKSLFLNDLLQQVADRDSLTSNSTRFKRSASANQAPISNGQPARSCSVQPFEMNKDDMPDSIYVFAPLKLTLNYCEGMCQYPIPHQIDTTAHALLRSYLHVHASDGPVFISPPCCVPTELKSTTLVIYYKNAWQLTVWKGVKVTGCGCR